MSVTVQAVHVTGLAVYTVAVTVQAVHVAG
jgi:hypothetical protein